jgi:K+-sensing histidine kinase KdpD
MRFFTTVHILLLAYIIAALFFWGLSLHRQSNHIYEQEKLILRQSEDSTLHPLAFALSMQRLDAKQKARTKQYLGEGITFLIVIIIGAFVVYSSFRRSIRLSRQQNNFMLAVTHELKSPIAAVKLNLQTLEKHQLDDTRRKLLLDRSIDESNRLNELCNKILYASQMEGKQYKAQRERFDMSALVESTISEYTIKYPSRFQVDVISACMVVGDKLLLQVAIHNLLENALKYTPPASPIIVRLFIKDQLLHLQVIDEGDGIPDDEKKKVFNKFYRLGSENTRTTKGTGLGLYLTSKIVQNNAGRITVRDNMPRGAIFEFTLPAA